MTKRYVYEATIAPDPSGGFIVTFGDVPEAITHGDTIAEARANAVEALGLALRGIAVEGRPLPASHSDAAGPDAIAPSAEDALKLAVLDAFRAAGISKSELARRIGKAENEARRILDPDHPTKIASLEAALAALGRQVVIEVRDAA